MAVPIQATLVFVFVGSAAIAAGMLGMRLPAATGSRRGSRSSSAPAWA